MQRIVEVGRFCRPRFLQVQACISDDCFLMESHMSLDVPLHK
jgi:hypothetical protein